MADLADLISSMNKATIAETSTSADQSHHSAGLSSNGHLLSFEYPACDLLPEGAGYPYLPAPSNVAQRERPPPTATEAGIDNTAFFVVLPLGAGFGATFHWAPPSVLALVAAVIPLHAHIGASKLRVVAFHHAQTGEIMHRVQLLTTRSNGGHVGTVLELELTNSEWESLVTKLRHLPWASMLQHLVRRGSDRAYYHVQERLIAAFDERWANDEIHWPMGGWNTNPPRDIRDLLRARLVPARMQDYQMLRDEDTEEAREGGSDALITFRLPCVGQHHTATLWKSELEALTDEDCHNMQCSQCKGYVLQKADYDVLAFRNEVIRRRNYIARLAEWTELQTTARKNDFESKQRSFPTLPILVALSTALSSLRTPTLTCPPPLSFVSLPETRAVLSNLEQYFHNRPDSSDALHCTALALLGYLERLALQSLAADIHGTERAGEFNCENDVPPGWTQNLREWLSRTVSFLIERRCKRRGQGHSSLHMHGERLWYKWGKDEEGVVVVEEEGEQDIGEEADEVVSMDALMAQLAL